MKNVHVLPTTQPSRLQLNIYSKKLILFNNIQSENESVHLSNQHIYITSDAMIETGDWYISESLNGLNKFKWTRNEKIKYVAKIILSTDPTLIRDGVQEIDDEFLEWFIKNPTCEYAEINDWLDVNGNIAFGGNIRYQICNQFHDKKIIIPQEEQKQHLINMMQDDEKLGLYEEPKQDLEKEIFELEQELDIPSSMRWHNSKPKQEILPEFTLSKGVFDKISDLPQEELYKKSLELNQEFIDNHSSDELDNVMSEFDYQAEEPKQDLEKEWTQLEDSKLCEPLKSLDESTQETLEEAAERLHPVTMLFDHNSRSRYNEKYDCNLERRNSFIEGAKWQAERSYNDFIHFGKWLLKQDITSRGEGVYINDKGELLTVEDLFEEFKK